MSRPDKRAAKFGLRWQASRVRVSLRRILKLMRPLSRMFIAFDEACQASQRSIQTLAEHINNNSRQETA